jgi:hypothetical protein
MVKRYRSLLSHCVCVGLVLMRDSFLVLSGGCVQVGLISVELRNSIYCTPPCSVHLGLHAGVHRWLKIGSLLIVVVAEPWIVIMEGIVHRGSHYLELAG